MKYVREVVSDRIKKLMLDNGMNQSALSCSTGIAQPKISACLNNQRDFSIMDIVEISECFQVSADYILGLENENSYKCEMLSDLYRLLFTLSEHTHIQIENTPFTKGERIPKADVEFLDYIHSLPLDEQEKFVDSKEYFELYGEYLKKYKDEFFEAPGSSGMPCICFSNQHLQSFLNEWRDALSMSLNFSNGSKLYETWKKGVLETGDFLSKEFGYDNVIDYQIQLAEKKITFCDCFKQDKNLSFHDLSDNEYESLSLDFERKMLTPKDVHLLRSYEKEFGDLRELPFLPNKRHVAR